MIITENISNAIPQLIKLLYGVLLTRLLPFIMKLIEYSYDIYLNKSAHIKVIKTNSIAVKDSIKEISVFNFSTTLTSFFSFFIGIPVGIIIGIMFSQIIESIFIKILDMEYIRNLLYPIPNAQNLAILQLNVQVFYSTCLNIVLFLFLIIVFLKCFKFVSSRNLLNPVLIEDSLIKDPLVNPKVIGVYALYNAFIGITVGVAVLLYTVLFGNLAGNSLINDNFSFSPVYFTDIYESLQKNVPYSNFYIFIHLLGFFTGLFIIIVLYCNITDISHNAIKAITNFYKCNFPYMKIITNNGEIKGKLKDIKNKSFLTLNENNVSKAVKWNNIEIMEIITVNETVQFIFEKDYRKNKW